MGVLTGRVATMPIPATPDQPLDLDAVGEAPQTQYERQQKEHDEQAPP